MTPIPFRANPAFVTLSEAAELAISHLRANLALWVVPTLIYSLVAGALTYVFTTRLVDRITPYARDPSATAAMSDAVLENLPGIVGFVLLLAIGGLAVYCFAMVLAVGGLPGRRMTVDRAMTAGLRTIVVGLLYVVASVGSAVAMIAFAVAVGSAASLLLFFVGIPVLVGVLVYLALRLAFALYAIFDGAGVIESVRMSWAMSRGGVLRTFGWLLALGAISFGISIAAGIAGAPFAALPAAGAVISALLTTAYQFFQATTLAILYESQRMRHVMSTPGMSVLPPGADAGGPIASSPVVQADPLQPPPPPGR